ncbi:hypothetical protein ACM25N_18420 [Roseovarius sp. C7]|uniref:hypothetical protein n=1 Tax=Roseovarius sp. C7 TaxID=3398643 RepID=UPI0039F71E8B
MLRSGYPKAVVGDLAQYALEVPRSAAWDQEISDNNSYIFCFRDMFGSDARKLDYVTESGLLAIRPDHFSARSANPAMGDRVFDDNLRKRPFSWQGLQNGCSPHDLPGG